MYFGILIAPFLRAWGASKDWERQARGEHPSRLPAWPISETVPREWQTELDMEREQLGDPLFRDGT
jgi:hypothetical protein